MLIMLKCEAFLTAINYFVSLYIVRQYIQEEKLALNSGGYVLNKNREQKRAQNGPLRDAADRTVLDRCLAIYANIAS